MNPLILNFRGNALAQLARYDEAVEDYEEATQIFDADREVRQASLSRANTGLALFGAGREPEAASSSWRRRGGIRLAKAQEMHGHVRRCLDFLRFWHCFKRRRGGPERSGRHGRARGAGSVVLGLRPGGRGGVAVDICL